ncbi:MAG: hypothetical protein IH914_00065 [candidate division Zixibacteria bacterium]|nr:hypothetical protein [candidate division Zixibacteria bacterium]
MFIRRPEPVRTLIYLAGAFAICCVLFTASAAIAQKTLSDVQSRELIELLKSMRQGGSSYPIPERAYKCGSAVALQYRAIEHELSPSLRREAARALARPSLPFYYDSPGGNFRIHYATSGVDAALNAGIDNIGPLGATGADGVPDYVNAVAEIFDSVRTRILGDTLSGNFGYPVPPPDTIFNFVADTNGLYDIYMPNLNGSFFGITFSETQVPNYFIPGNPFSSFTSYIQIDNDYVEPSYSAVNDYLARPLDAVRVTAAHEYFHAIHFGIDAFEFGGNPNRFYWYEMSAVSMEELIYDGINDYYAYLYNTFNPTLFRQPHRSLQTFSFVGPDADFAYAYGVFAMFLNDEFGPNLQLGIWRGCGRQGPDFLRAIDSALIAHTSGEYDFSKAFQEFAIRMAFTGSKAKFAPPGRKLDEAEFFPEITDTTRPDVNPDTTAPSPTVHTTYPLIVLTNTQVPPPESNSHTFTLLKNVYTVGDGCFRLFAGKATFTPPGIKSRLALIGYPANRSGTAFVSIATEDTVFLDTSILVNPFDFDSITQVYRDSFSCHDFVEIQFDSLIQDSFRIIVANRNPSVELPDPGSFEEAVFIFTQTDTNFANYEVSRTTPFNFFYLMTDSVIATTAQPYGVFSSFPNPVTPGDNFVTIGFDRSIAQPPSTPLALDVTILTESGEKVRANLPVQESVGLELGVIWDLRNQSDREVASGVYILLLQLLSADGRVLQSETSKILVIR